MFMVATPSSLRPGVSPDYRDYYRPVAERLVDGKGFTAPDNKPAIQYGPGYPLLLALAFTVADVVDVDYDLTANVVVVISLALACLLTFDLTRRIFGERAAWFAAALWITYPINLTMAAQPYSEGPFTAALTAAVLIFVVALANRTRVRPGMFAVGALAGVAALIRPAGLLLAVPLILGLWVWERGTAVRQRLLLSVLVAAGFLSVIGPWEVWAFARADKLVPISDGGIVAVVAGLAPGFETVGGARHVPVSDDLNAVLLAVHGRYEAEPFDSVTEIGRFLWDETADNRGVLVELLAYKLVRSWYGTDSLRLEQPIAVVQLGYLSVAGAGMVMALRRGADQRRLAILVLLLVALFWLMTVSVLAIVRYMAPALSLLFPFLGLALVTAYDRIKAARAARTPRKEDRPTRAATADGLERSLDPEQPN
jgi:4-amino-4-deoxy-L-arabinose transferase-like glycosyltransferase